MCPVAESPLGDDQLVPLAVLLTRHPGQLLDGIDEGDGDVDQPPSNVLIILESWEVQMELT